MLSGDHSMRKYDEELEAIRSRVLHMGGLVESQVRTALAAFDKGDLDLAQQAIDADRRVNDLELELDQMVIHVIARRQPTAGDLRMIIGTAKAIGGHRAHRRRSDQDRARREVDAREGRRHADAPRSRRPALGEIAVSMLRRTLDAFARLDTAAAAAIIKDDQGVDDRFRAILRQLITFMMEDPRTISTSLDIVWAAKAIERIGDHAKNIAEFIIFISQGVDMRHMTPDEVERALARG